MHSEHKDVARPPAPLLARLGWLVGLWAAGVAALGVVAWLLRQVMALAGLTT